MDDVTSSQWITLEPITLFSQHSGSHYSRLRCLARDCCHQIGADALDIVKTCKCRIRENNEHNNNAN